MRMTIDEGDHDRDELNSWLESRRLIIAQLRQLDSSIKELGHKIEESTKDGRARTDELAKEQTKQISDLTVRTAMIEVRVKLAAAIIAAVSATVATRGVELVSKLITR
jgi:hypothetical protein